MTKASAGSREPYEIELSSIAEAAYSDYRRRAEKASLRGDVSNSHITTFNMLQDAFRAISAHPTERKYALAGHLACMYRIKKGRMRICWIVSPDQRRVCVLFISETMRKEGDAQDPYEVFTKMVMSGKFNEILQGIGMPLPDISAAADYKIQ